MKRGDKFIHAKWLNENNQPLRCEVTKVAQGVVYWKVEGERRARQFFPLEDVSKYVKETL